MIIKIKERNVINFLETFTLRLINYIHYLRTIEILL